MPSLLGSPGTRWFTEIIQQWFFEGQDWNQGSAYAFLLLILCTGFVMLMMRLLNVAPDGHRQVSGRPMIDEPARPRLLLRVYVVIFFAYLFVPLLIMGGAALNDTKFPSVYPVGRHHRPLVRRSVGRRRMWNSTRNTVLVALAVVAISLPIGTAAAILINSLRGRGALVPLRR